MRIAVLVLLAAATLAGCGQNDTNPGPGDVTQGEARALDDAAEMLDERKPTDDAAASPTPSPAASETPAAEPSG